MSGCIKDPEAGEQRLFPNSAIISRPALTWPQGVRVALSVVLHFEAMDLDAPLHPPADPRWRERKAPDLRYNSFYEYGNRVAIYRLLDLFDRHELKITVAANALACERFPDLTEAFLERGYEIAAHGIAANRMISSSMSEKEETLFVRESLGRITAIIAQKPRGWIGQDFGESFRTPALLAQEGLSYLADWPNDDEPYVLPGAGGIVSVPIAYEWDDMRLFIERRIQAWHYPPMLHAALKALSDEGGTRPRVLPISVHPWVFGAPHRVRYLAQTLEALTEAEGLKSMHAAAIAETASPGGPERGCGA